VGEVDVLVVWEVEVLVVLVVVVLGDVTVDDELVGPVPEPVELNDPT
jgi:hypothetical protein